MSKKPMKRREILKPYILRTTRRGTVQYKTVRGGWRKERRELKPEAADGVKSTKGVKTGGWVGYSWSLFKNRGTDKRKKK